MFLLNLVCGCLVRLGGQMQLEAMIIRGLYRVKGIKNVEGLTDRLWTFIEDKRRGFVDKSIDHGAVDDKGVQHIVNTVLTRQKFLFTGKDILQYVVSCGRD